MTARLDEIKGWVELAEQAGDVTHLLVVTDTFDNEDYPVPVGKKENVNDVIADYRNKDMSRVEEVYSFTGAHSIVFQLREDRAWHTD